MKSRFLPAACVRAACPYSFAFFVFLSVMGWNVLSEGYPNPWVAALIALATAVPIFIFRLWRSYRRAAALASGHLTDIPPLWHADAEKRGSKQNPEIFSN